MPQYYRRFLAWVASVPTIRLVGGLGLLTFAVMLVTQSAIEIFLAGFWQDVAYGLLVVIAMFLFGCIGLITIWRREIYQGFKISGWPAVILGVFILATFWLASGMAAYSLTLILLQKE